MKKLLIVVDMQNDFIDGSLGTEEAKQIVPAVVKKIEEYQGEDCEILFTMDTHYENYLETLEGKKLPVVHCQKGTQGWELCPEIAAFEGTRFEKPSFASLDLGRYVGGREYKSVELAGLCTDICVISNAMLIKAVAMALENHKALRSTMADENHIKISSRIHIGVAVDIPGGLIVPVIRDANMKDLRTICLELSDLTQRAKDNKLTSDQLGGATITITNLGMFGITYFTPVLNVPESAILGVGAIIEKLMVKDGGFYPASVMNFSLTHDHRIVNGAPAARFLKEVTASLQDFKWV